jgi:two-component system NtrC family sensor kinase
MKLYIKNTLPLMLFVLSSFIYGQDLKNNNVFELKNDQIQNYIGKHLEVLELNDDVYSVQAILKNKLFVPSNSSVPNLGVKTKTHWIKFSVTNLTDRKEFIIQYALASVDYINFYAFYPNGSIDSIKTGDCRPFSNRDFARPDFAFKLSLSKNESALVLFKVKGGEQVQAPINIGERKMMARSFMDDDLLVGLYAGIILVMVFYNLFIYTSTKDQSYLFYVFYILIVGLTQLNFLGYTSKYLWPDSTYISNIAVYILSSITAISSMEFMKRFLSTKIKVNQLHRYFNIFYFIYYVSILLAFLKYYTWSYQIIQINATLAALYILFVAWRISKQGYRPAKFFLAAWSTFLVGVCIFVLKDVGILPYNKFTYYTMPIGSALEVILLSLALGDRINILSKEKEDSQLKNLILLQENEQIIKEQNVMLERKVRERTAELEASNKSLKEAEAILINAEKMASLGQLTAGISHEINNPINFVVSNINPLKRDMEEILLILSKYGEINETSDLKQKLSEINALKIKLDMNYLIDEIHLLLKGIDEGAKRTVDIVKGLKSFSRTDEDELSQVNIHDGIELTLTLLNNSISNSNTTVIKNFGSVPEIECYHGQIKQVFMNLLSNSIQAVENRKDKNSKGLITIHTFCSEKNVTIKISDNGTGISQKNLPRIFEPFFTTKDVGEGTGLGLSIVYGIITKHNGNIDVISEENNFTTFIINLPINQ